MKYRVLKIAVAAILLAVSLTVFLLPSPGSEREIAPETSDVETLTETAVTETEDETEELPTTTAPETAEDTEPPFFLMFSPTVTLKLGASFEIHRYISYLDDRDPEVILSVDGSVNTAILGEYPLKLTLTDHAGNVATAAMTVKVTQPTPSAPSAPPAAPKSFAEFAARYKSDETMVGIDVSKWQGDIDFQKVAAAGCEFVIIRIGGYADGVFTDRYYKNNIKNAKEAGLKVGVYWYSEENGAAMVRENAAYLYSLLDGEELDFPIFFDWEDYINFENYKMSKRDLNDMFLAFRKEAEARGYKAALYNSKNPLGLLWTEEVKEGGVWLAHYVNKTNYTGEYFLWQQGFGRIDGIKGDVDVDVFYPEALFWF